MDNLTNQAKQLAREGEQGTLPLWIGGIGLVVTIIGIVLRFVVGNTLLSTITIASGVLIFLAGIVWKIFDILKARNITPTLIVKTNKDQNKPASSGRRTYGRSMHQYYDY